MSTTLIISLIGAGILLLLIIIFFLSNRKMGKIPKFTPSVAPEEKKEESDFEVKEESDFEFTPIDNESLTEADLEPVISESYEVEDKEEKPFDFEAFYNQIGESDNKDDFEEFQEKHSYKNYLTNEILADSIKNLPKDIKILLVSDILKKKDFFNDEY
ncbi:MAG: hypothetical protein IJ008_03065 [Clostridia bacterium]|nr:hypothetical protein [Clostridia bacterium]